MTPEEIQKQQEIEKAFIAEYLRRKALGVSGDDCETESDTNAEVCVRVTGVDIDCNKSYTGDSYRDCDVSLNYVVETDYEGGSYLDVDVDCEAEIEYKGSSYSSRSDSDSSSESHSLSASGSDSDSMELNFSFSSYEEVYKAEVSSSHCEIDSVTLQ